MTGKKEYRSAVTLLGGGDFFSRDLRDAIDIAPVLVCADGAANDVSEQGLEPDLIVGDLDSISTEVRERFPEKLVRIDDQDTTDFDKCLSHVAAPLIVCIGFTGFRLDHELAALASLAKYTSHPALLITRYEICFRVPQTLEMQIPESTTVSVFPFSSVSARSKGLKWPLDGLKLHPSGIIGTSNLTTGPRLEIRVDQGNLLIMLPRSELQKVAQALRA